MNAGIFVPLGAFAMITTIVIGVPLVRGLVKRWEREGAAPRVPAELQARLERMEQAMDAIAIEVERMSEGQRYVAKVITEGSPPLALGPGQHPAEPIRISDEDRLRVRRGE